MKLKGIKVQNVDVKDGRVVKKQKRVSVSERIRQRSSKRMKVAK